MPPPHKTTTAVLLAVLSVCAQARDPVAIPWGLPALSAPPRATPAPEHNVGGVKAVFLDGLPWRGKPTRILAYPLDSLQKSCRLPGSSRHLAIRLRMPHSQGDGQAPPEILAFADSSSEHEELPGSTLHGLVPLGKIKPLASREIQASRWSIGGETLDRDYADYHAYKRYLGPSGAKRIRLQGGWAKCESVKGQHDFDWLDKIVDDAISQGVSPWIQTSYGNPIYEGGGQKTLAGGIPTSDEALRAWDAWVRALVTRYKDRVHEWEIWNEPDISKQMSAEEFAVFFVRTVKIVKEVQPESRIIALGLAGVGNTKYVTSILDILKAEGLLHFVDAIAAHGYTARPEQIYPSFAKLREVLAAYGAHIEVWQGESGAPTTRRGQSTGALTKEDWSELTQAKWVLRKMMGDMGHDIDVTNIFTLSDLYYAAGDHLKGLNSKGLLKARPDGSIERPKRSYHAYQHAVSLFSGTLTRFRDLDPRISNKDLSAFAFQKEGIEGAAMVYWFSGSKPADEHQVQTISFTARSLPFNDPVLINLLDGTVHRLPDNSITHRDGRVNFTGLPALDSPLVIADRSWFQLLPNP